MFALELEFLLTSKKYNEHEWLKGSDSFTFWKKGCRVSMSPECGDVIYEQPLNIFLIFLVNVCFTFSMTLEVFMTRQSFNPASVLL